MKVKEKEEGREAGGGGEVASYTYICSNMYDTSAQPFIYIYSMKNEYCIRTKYHYYNKHHSLL